MMPITAQRLRMVAPLALAALLSTQMGGCPSVLDLDSATVQDVTPAEADALIQAHQGDPNFVVLDVRTETEYAEGHIENATNLCIRCVVSFEEDVQAFDKTLTYLVYCGSGSRSSNATSIMVDVGFTNVYNMIAGMTQWQAEGYPVVVQE